MLFNSPVACVTHITSETRLDEILGAFASLPEGSKHYITYPTSLTAAALATLTVMLPYAELVAVGDEDTDLTALFSLMRMVDLSTYPLVCKVHFPDGPIYPSAWRQALLRGVLASPAQVTDILSRFAADPQIMMAGTKQLYIHGSNAPDMAADQGDSSPQDWGFITGACFWIRPEILNTIKAQAHPATEADFGRAVARRRGKILLQDLRFPNRAPELSTAWAPDMVRKQKSLSELLTQPVVYGWIKPTDLPLASPPLQQRERVAVFASYSDTGFLPPQVMPYLAGLKPLVSKLVVVCDNPLQPEEIARLQGLADHVITGRHGEYDFGSYKRGIAWLRKMGHLDTADALILCNDSAYGPVRSFAPMFAKMEATDADFWGATESHEIDYHLQSYFVVMERPVFESAAFRDFLGTIAPQKNVRDVILKYEIGMSKQLVKAGFKASGFVTNAFTGAHPNDPSYRNLVIEVLHCLRQGLPLVKTKALHKPSTTYDGASATIAWLRENDPALHRVVQTDTQAMRLSKANELRFSVIMPSYNRSWCIRRAIDAIFAQTHRNFELIVVDDGSTDDTVPLLKTHYAQEIKDGRLRLVVSETNGGVCRARNIGLAHARADWVAYADTDNEARPHFLEMFAHAILAQPERDAFYGRMLNLTSGKLSGKPFASSNIVAGNFIDLGVFVHRRTLINRFGGFDDSLRRLVDWDFCIRLTRHQEPVYIDRVLLDYHDDDLRGDRISVQESYLKAEMQVFRKHSPRPTITTAILCYNQRDFIVEAIESALAQTGDFHHEILLSDDGSTDGTQRIIRHYAALYPKRIRNISRPGNHGVSANYRHCFTQAQGEFVAILEGDDYWTDPAKLQKQASFLSDHPKAAMVFSRIEVLNADKGTRRLLKRQDQLPAILHGSHFAANEHLNLIANLSSTMFRHTILRDLPDAIFEPRLNEIALAFHIDQRGSFGFLPEVMSVYRLNVGSVWTGASAIEKLRQAIAAREAALRIAHPSHHATIRAHIALKQKALGEAIAKEKEAA